MAWELVNGTIVTPREVIEHGSVQIEKNRITQVAKSIRKQADVVQIDVNGMLVFPGLINCHDHLLGTYVPRVGDRRPYLNWLEWDNDLKSSPVYAERQQIDSSDLYQLGGYRHLLCGITRVQDHIPHFVREAFARDMPIRIIADYALAHSVTSFALKWGDGIEIEHAKAKEKNIPFITHCSEGFDEETLKSVETLAAKNALSRQTVLIHGIAFSDRDMELLAQHQCHVVWCPVSNLYMFERTARVKELLDLGINVALGTDSPMSGSFSIFEEMRTAKEFYRFAYGRPLDDRVLVNMLTVNAAKAMCLPDAGEIAEGKAADLLLIDGDTTNPWAALTNADYADIMLVIVDGQPRYGDFAFAPVFEAFKIPYQTILVKGVRKIVAGDVLGLQNRVRRAVKFQKELDFLPVEAA
ncbi:MAG: amidohydrolase family protein [Turneriella sp.]|nr:amidohydrolase family protein [Leptospiraceae bacterium]MCX7632026.1 amidohydrolase family protein [Turneriella sp.]